MDGLGIAASLSEITPLLHGAALRTVSQPASGQFVLRLFGAGEDIRLLIDLGAAAIYRINQPLRNPPQPTPFVMLLRKHLRGTRVTGIRQLGMDRSVTIELSRQDGGSRTSYAVVAELTGAHANLHLLRDTVVVRSLRDDPRNRVGDPFAPLPVQEKQHPQQISPEIAARWLSESPMAKALVRGVHGIGRHTAMDLIAEDLGDDPALTLCLRIRDVVRYTAEPDAHLTSDGTRATFYPLPPPALSVPSYQEALNRAHAGQREAEPSAGPDDLIRELRRAVRTNTRTRQKLRDWMDQAHQADTWQVQADLLMTFASSVPSGLRQVTLVDPSTEAPVTIPLDPSLSARENAQRLYDRAKRLRRGHPHVRERMARVERNLALLETSLEARERGDAVPEEVLQLLPGRRARATSSVVARPFRRFEAGGFAVWMGRSAAENDALLRAASPNDLWLHAKDFAGSHVVVRKGGRLHIPDDVIQAAARLAARHSKAAAEGRVEVVVTQVKHVRKPKGAPPGLASVRVSDTLTVNREKGDR